MVDPTGGSQQAEVPVIVQLLDHFQLVFVEPNGLQWHKESDHAIPLFVGAKPMNMRPYRYTPEQKSEIEAQVKEIVWSHYP